MISSLAFTIFNPSTPTVNKETSNSSVTSREEMKGLAQDRWDHVVERSTEQGSCSRSESQCGFTAAVSLILSVPPL